MSRAEAPMTRNESSTMNQVQNTAPKTSGVLERASVTPPSSHDHCCWPASSLWRRLWKPWFVWRPMQVLRRARLALSSPRPGYQLIPTSWGGFIWTDPTKVIGRSILTTGIYDLAVSEVLARLIKPGDTVIDAGANIGYMTMLASFAAGPNGKVLSFEPHPDL